MVNLSHNDTPRSEMHIMLFTIFVIVNNEIQATILLAADSA